MSALHKLSPFKKSGNLHSAFTAVVDAGVYTAASWGFGYTQQRWREKASVAGVPADLAAGVGLSAAALVLGDIMGYGEHVMPIVKAVGHAGLGAWAHTHGAGTGAQKSGVRRLLVQEKDVARVKAAVPTVDVLGSIPQAPHGDFLSPRDLANLAR